MKHLLYTLFFVLSLSHLHLNAQVEFYNTFSSTTSVFIISKAQDSQGNYVVSGYFEGSMDLDPGPGTFNVTSAGNQDIFVVKLNPQGQFLWGKTYGGAFQDFGREVHVDADDNIWLSGTFQRNVDFNPGGEGGMLMNSNGTTGGNRSNSFLLKLNAAGEFQKVFHFRNAAPGADNNIRSFEIDNDGNFTVFGTFSGTLNTDPFINSSPLSTANPNSTNSTTFIVRIDPNADSLVWSKHFDGPQTFRILSSIACDADANVYGVGAFNGTFSLNPDIDSLILTAENEALFIFKMNHLGEYVWAKTVASTGTSRCLKAIVESENLYVTGRFNSTLNFNNDVSIQTNGETDVFALKMDLDGNFIWARSWGNESDGDGIQSINIGSDGRILVSMSFTDSVDANPGQGEQILTSAGGTDFYVVSLTSEGDYIDVFHSGGINSDFVFDASYHQGVYTLLGSSRATFLINPPLAASEISVTATLVGFLAHFTPADGSTSTQDLPANEIKIYPNPARQTFTIQNLPADASVRILDLQGRVILHQIQSYQNTFNLNDCNLGLYFVQVEHQQQLHTCKLLIH
ncbi:MAG: T9SS type A sorting domain-containing protein [Flavobacteriales bacterium]